MPWMKSKPVTAASDPVYSAAPAASSLRESADAAEIAVRAGPRAAAIADAQPAEQARAEHCAAVRKDDSLAPPADVGCAPAVQAGWAPGGSHQAAADWDGCLASADSPAAGWDPGGSVAPMVDDRSAPAVHSDLARVDWAQRDSALVD